MERAIGMGNRIRGASALLAAGVLWGGNGASGEPPRPFEQRLSGTTVALQMVPIPAGETAVPTGDSRMLVSLHPVYMSATEITWDLYDLFVYRLDEEEGEIDPAVDAVTRPSKPYIPPDRGFGHAGYPAISMSARGAQEFCAWLSVRTGRRYRLPTEAEWQHACLAGRAGPYGFEDPGPLAEYAWFKGNAGDQTRPVGQKRANAWGLYDMHGNVAEWVIGADGKPLVRGGSYLDPSEAVTAFSRARQTPDWNASDPQFPKSSWWLADCTFVGFRIVCEMEPDAPTGKGKDDDPL
jgi:formylglycine-generating enzyme required for sulfatase activity